MATDGRGEEFGVSAVHIDAIDREVVEVMRELSAEDNLERFKVEYERLHRALKKSHESEKRLIKKCQELNQEIMANAAKVQAALKLSQDDENTIIALRKEIEKAWKMVDGAHEKESRAKDTIQMLKKEVNRLTQLVEQGAGLTLGQETNLQELIELKKELTKARDAYSQKVVVHTQELKDLQEKVKKFSADVLRKDTELQQRTALYAQLSKEHETEMRKKELAEGRVQDLHSAIEKRSKDLDVLKEHVRRKTEDQERLEKFLKDERDKVHELSVKTEKVQRELQAHTELFSQKDAQLSQQRKEIPRREAELDSVMGDYAALQGKQSKMMKAVESQDRELQRIEADKVKEYDRTQELEQSITTLMSTIEAKRRVTEDLERRLKDKVRDKNLTITVAVRDEQERVKLEGEASVEAGRNRSLAQEVSAHQAENQQLRKTTYQLSQQTSKYQSAATEATERCRESLEDVKLAKQRIATAQQELEEGQLKLKNQSGLYDQVLADRNLYSKSLKDAESEITEMKRRFKIVDHQIDQLKDELRKKESDLCAAHAKLDTVVKDREAAKEQVKGRQADYKHVKERGDKLEHEIKQLSQIIADCDTEKAKQLMKFNSVTNERNILATQLIRRNEELALLYEKIRIQQSTLGKGSTQYRDRIVDIRMLREKVHELRTSLRASLARIRYVEELKRQIATLQRQVIQERTKVKALFEELQNPMNVHRWRKMEGSDPQEYENILKLQTLQRRLIAKTEELRQKAGAIKEKETQYGELKTILARQPGPEIAEQLSVFHDNIVRRSSQMKAMDEELRASTTQVDEYRLELDRLQSELAQVKQKYFTLKSQNAVLVKDRQAAMTAAQPRLEGDSGHFVVRQPLNQHRFAGGGFALTV